jgi:hypothetical protein
VKRCVGALNECIRAIFFPPHCYVRGVKLDLGAHMAVRRRGSHILWTVGSQLAVVGLTCPEVDSSCTLLAEAEGQSAAGRISELN